MGINKVVRLGLSIAFHILNTLSQALSEILEKQKHADRVIDKYFRINKNWKSEEKHFFAQAVYDIVRHKKRLAWSVNSEELWSIIAAYLVEKNMKIPARSEFQNIDLATVAQRLKSPKSDEIEYSFPDWLHDIGHSEFLGQWSRIMKSLNQDPPVYLRVNTLKTSIEKLLKDLKSENINAFQVKGSLAVPEALVLNERQPVFATSLYRKGEFEMQDAGSQSISRLLQVEPGHAVVDACAGSGGKTLHMAALMKNKGKILALDVVEQKLKDLKIRAEKAGATCIETKLITSFTMGKSLENKFDRVLIDSPCSGLGVLRRNPEAKWRLNKETILELLDTQKSILANYSKLCKPGGVMVYATCSILRRENEEQIRYFLNSSVGSLWDLQSEHRVWPQEHDCDGFFAAVLKRKER